MGRKSSIKAKPPEWRSYLDKLLRADRYTLDDIIELMREQFPAEPAPSRSALGRHSQKFDKFMQRTRAAKEMGAAMVTELGEDPHDRGGQLLVEAITTLATHAAMDANDPAAKALSMKEVGELARASRAVLQARKLSLAERQQIAQDARDALQREQRVKLDELGKSGAIDQATLNLVIKAAYDL